MILNVSGRCDIVAFYTDWFLKRYREGFVDVRNPFYPKQVSRIYFEDVDLIVFCTKNPKPIVPYLKEIHKPILFQVTLTPYKRDVEPNVIKKEEIIESIKQISNELGREFVSVRYDPIFISKKYSLSGTQNSGRKRDEGSYYRKHPAQEKRPVAVFFNPFVRVVKIFMRN